MEVLLNQRSSLFQQLTMLKIEKINKPEKNYDKIIEESEGSLKEIDDLLDKFKNSNSEVAYISSLKVQALSTTFKKGTKELFYSVLPNVRHVFGMIFRENVRLRTWFLVRRKPHKVRGLCVGCA